MPESSAEEIAAQCHEAGSCGAEIKAQEGIAELAVYFPSEAGKAAAIDQVRGALSRAEISGIKVAVSRIEQQDWEEEWRRFFAPVWVTPRMVVGPTWIPVDTGPEVIRIALDPRMAFGTGTHESTQLCLRMLETSVQPGDHCLDLGTGSGILSIAAARLGAQRVLALDVDAIAVNNAKENLAQNQIPADQVTVEVGSIGDVDRERFDLVVANIQSSVLLPMLSAIARSLAPAGRVAFSGLLNREADEFCQSVASSEMEVMDVQSSGEWACVTAKCT